MTMEGIDDSLHGLGGIEEIPSKIGVFSRTQKLRSEGTRHSEGFSTWLEGLESLQRVTQSPRYNISSRTQESKKGKLKFIQMRHKMNAIDTRSKAPRAQGGRGLLSHTISVQESQKSISKILPLEKRREEQEEKRRAPGDGRWRAVCLWLAQGGERRG